MAAKGVDPIKAEVVARYLFAIAEEMGATLVRAAFSPNLKQRADCATAIFDAQGEVIALAERAPIHLGSMFGAIDEILKRYPRRKIAPGDMFIASDPRSGDGTHFPDINIVAPVFSGKRIVAFVANIAHLGEAGGMAPGSETAMCQSILQEGIPIPPVRIMRKRRLNPDVVDLIPLNSRTAHERMGDLNAQFAANRVGAKSVVRLFQRFGIAETGRTITALLNFTEKRFRAAIGRLAPGRYVAEDFLDGNTPDSTCRITLALTAGRDCLEFDFSGSDPQYQHARNIPYRALLATVYTVTRSLLDPDVPANSGYYRTLHITAPPGCVVDPIMPPARIDCSSISAAVLGDVIANALSQAMPDHAFAASGPHHQYVLAGIDPRTGAHFVDCETVAGGMGARAIHDGMDGVRVHASGSSNLPIEALEHAYPFRIERYALWNGSGGPGKYRGGMGVVRDYRVLGDGIVASLSSERQHVAARGVQGGGAGACGAFILNPDTPQEERLPAAVREIALPLGGVLRICTPGGGGCGDPAERDSASHVRDLREERIAREDDVTRAFVKRNCISGGSTA